MEKYRLISIGLVIGTIIAAIIFFLGITYISGTITFIISITIGILLIFGYFLIKYNAKRNIEIDKHEENVKKLTNDIKSIFPAINSENSLKELISSSIKAIRSIYTSTFLLSTFFSLSMVIVGLLASTIAIKQNNTMRDQNYLICQQNQYLETNIKYNLFTDPNEHTYNYLNTIKNEIHKELEIFGKTLNYMEKYWSYSSALVLLKNQKLNIFLPQKEYRTIIDLRDKIIKLIKKNDPNDSDLFLELIEKYKKSLLSFDTKINDIKEKLKKNVREEKRNYIKINPQNCSKYNN